MSILGIGWGGRGTSSGGYRTRWVRASSAGTGSTALTVQKHSPGSSAPISAVWSVSSVNATLPTDPESLFSVDWDVHGGNGELFPAIPWFTATKVGAIQQICCRNIAGTDANLSNYWVMWEE